MATEDLVLEVLKDIRSEIRSTKVELGARIDATNQRLDGVKTELGAHLDVLERRQTETEVRLATELVAVATAVRDVKDLLAARLDLSDKVQDLDRRVSVLESRPVQH